MTLLSAPQFLATINGLTKDTKQLIDNSVETMAIKQDFTNFVKATPTNEIDEKFVSTVTLGTPKKTPEGGEAGKNNTAEGHTTIISMQDKVTLSDIYSYEFYKAKGDKTQKIEDEYTTNVRRKMNSMRNQMNVDVYSMLNLGFSGASPYLSPDLEPVYSANHTFTDSSAVSFDNLLSASAPSLDVIKEVERRAGAFVDVEGRPMPTMPKKILTKMGGKASYERKQILFGTDYRANTLVGPNGTRITSNGEYSVVETPYLTSNTAYHFMSDFDNMELDNPFYFGVVDFPTIFGSDTNVNTLTTQVTYVSYYKLGLKNIPIGIYGSLGA